MEPSKKISQEYFDQIVSENVNDFGMSEEEAIADAVNQLKSQGCELVNICKHSRSEQDELLNAAKTLYALGKSGEQLASEEGRQKAVDSLKTMKKKFEKDVSFRCLANSVKLVDDKSAYEIMMEFLSSEDVTKDLTLLENYLSAFQAFLYQQSDAIDKNGLNTLVNRFHFLMNN